MTDPMMHLRSLVEKAPDDDPVQWLKCVENKGVASRRSRGNLTMRRVSCGAEA